MKPDTVTASEIGEFVFCPEAFCRAAIGTKPTSAIQTARAEGTAHHATLTHAEITATTSIRRGRGLVALGVAVLLAALLWLALQ